MKDPYSELDTGLSEKGVMFDFIQGRNSFGEHTLMFDLHYFPDGSRFLAYAGEDLMLIEGINDGEIIIPYLYGASSKIAEIMQIREGPLGQISARWDILEGDMRIFNVKITPISPEKFKRKLDDLRYTDRVRRKKVEHTS